jgi:hypothetical protein
MPRKRYASFGALSSAVWLIALLSFPADSAAANNPTPIGTVLADARAYEAGPVFLQGFARDVRSLEPYALEDIFVCYRAYTFVLQDATGAIEVGVRGICRTPAMQLPVPADPQIREGQSVFVEARIHPPGAYSGEGFPLFGDVLPTAKATALSIRRLPGLD